MGSGFEYRHEERLRSRHWPVLLAAAGAALLILGGLFILARPSVPTSSQTAGDVTASRAYGFDSISAMAAASDLVAKVTILDASSDSVSLTATDYRLRVERVLLNHTRDTVGDEIDDHELGNAAATNLWVEDQVIYQPGQRLVLFLNQYEPDRFTTIAGPESAFTIHDGRVDALAKNPAEGVRAFTGPMELAAFEALIRGASG